MKLEATLQILKAQLSTAQSALITGPCALERPVINETGVVLIVDGGLRHWPDKPTNALLIGDGDSCPPDTPVELFDLRLPPQKDRSDLSYALGLLPLSLGCLELLGFRGGRFDHELIVMGEIYQFLKTHSQCHVKLGTDIQGFGAGKHQFEQQGLFSVLSLETMHLCLEGDLDYEAQNLVLTPFSSQALSNRAFGKIGIQADAPFFIYAEASCP